MKNQLTMVIAGLAALMCSTQISSAECLDYAQPTPSHIERASAWKDAFVGILLKPDQTEPALAAGCLCFNLAMANLKMATMIDASCDRYENAADLEKVERQYRKLWNGSACPEHMAKR